LTNQPIAAGAPADLSLVTCCRGCHSQRLVPILSLGSTPLANGLLSSDDTLQALRYPLDVVRCAACSLVQLAQVIAPERLFTEYAYFSSYSDAMLLHARELAAELIRAQRLDARSLVIEVASNDGYLLQFFRAAGVPVLGIEPARNVAQVAERERGIPTRVDFLTPHLARALVAEGYQADVLIGINVLAHAPALIDFVEALAILLRPKGVLVIEVPYIVDMVNSTEFDTIYHEHQSYFSVTALDEVFESRGLEIVEVERLPIHGGSLRLTVCHRGARHPSERVRTIRREEQAWGVCGDDVYSGFAARVTTLRQNLAALVHDLKVRGHSVAAYGAAAKGVTLLSCCGLGRGQLDFVVDRSPHKQGLRFPVDGLPIYPPSMLREARIDFALMLTWNFAEEILRQQADYIRAGGRFIVPVPTPTVVSTTS
jgi:SAM-dependent methyltransferase